MSLNFKDKTIIVTGGTRGIGNTIAEAFYKNGGKVIITGTKNPNNPTLADVKKRMKYFQLNMLSNQSVENFIKKIKALDKIDVLVNNAGINKIDTVYDISIKDWEHINKVNLAAPFLITKEVSKKMVTKKQGRIVNISSIFGVISKGKRAAYSSSKWGLIGLTKAVAIDLAPFNIQVNAISPGFVDTDLTRRILNKQEINALRKSIPQGRLAHTQEIADLVIFLSGDNNTYITGQNIVIDGGYTIV